MGTYPDWIYRQSAVAPFRVRDGELEVLMITSRGGRRWVLPKGIVEPGLSAQISAAKEAREEAGIEGAVWDRPLGSYTQDKWGGTCRIEVFPMQVTTEHEDWPEANIRRRKWLSVRTACKRVEDKALRALLESLPGTLSEQGGRSARPEVTVLDTPRLLYLLRHAKSSWDNPSLDDFDRPLAARGLAASETMRDYLRLADVSPALVICSSAVRTRQTLAGVRAALGDAAVVRFADQIYHGGAHELLDQLRQVPDAMTSVMLIAHNPAMESLALLLADTDNPEDRARMASKFPTAALATLVLGKLSWNDLGPESCKLHSFVIPRDLA